MKREWIYIIIIGVLVAFIAGNFFRLNKQIAVNSIAIEKNEVDIKENNEDVNIVIDHIFDKLEGE